MEDHGRWRRKSGDFLAKKGRATARVQNYPPRWNAPPSSGGKYLVSGMLWFLAEMAAPPFPPVSRRMTAEGVNHENGRNQRGIGSS